jgi:hypothetical protein
MAIGEEPRKMNARRRAPAFARPDQERFVIARHKQG